MLVLHKNIKYCKGVTSNYTTFTSRFIKLVIWLAVETGGHAWHGVLKSHFLLFLERQVTIDSI
jgi:hypothetical protein